MDYAQESLASHNHYRTLHGVPPLVLNTDLVTKSRQYAAELLKKGKLEHSKGNLYGENLYYSMSTDPMAVHKASDAVKSWYDEYKFYNFNKERNDLQKTGHFTQLIWRNTKEMGAGYASKDGTYYVVANYKPAGNVVGEYMNNVPPIVEVALENSNEGADLTCSCKPGDKINQNEKALNSDTEKEVTVRSDVDDKKKTKKRLISILKHFCCFIK